MLTTTSANANQQQPVAARVCRDYERQQTQMYSRENITGDILTQACFVNIM